MERRTGALRGLTRGAARTVYAAGSAAAAAGVRLACWWLGTPPFSGRLALAAAFRRGRPDPASAGPEASEGGR
jgi:hypothetical protein